MESKYALPNKNSCKIGANNKSNYIHNIERNDDDDDSIRISKFSKRNMNSDVYTMRQQQKLPHKVRTEELQTLPIMQCRQHLMQEINKLDTVIIMGETGSGKTTQIPQLLLEDGYGNKGIVAITQPRRVAAITVAKRVAQEMHCQLGELVGYTVRFEDCTSPKTRIRYMTDGFLLRETLADQLLKNYSVIMLDEAHERTVNTDVLFGVVKKAQKERKLRHLQPLKIIVTSATMDIDHFGQYFGVHGLYLEGRAHPVRVLHVKEPQADYLHATLVTLFDIHRSMPPNNDILIFLTGQEEIEAMAQQIRQIIKTNLRHICDVRIFPLYAQLPQNKQLECFLPAPSNTRKIILATNIAETSITIPGIRCVIDAGFVKRRTYTATGLDILKIVRISQAQAWQRCGRAGRDAPGACYRTYTQREMAMFEKMPKPEILRSNICSVVLQLLVLGIDCRTFDFLDAPSPEAIEVAYRKLESLGAIRYSRNDRNIPELTLIGRQMAQFPLDPQYSKLLLAAPQFGCMKEILHLVAILSGENIFIQNTEKREQAALAHAKFESKHGDHLTLINVFNVFLKTEKFKVWCHDNFLNIRNLLYAREVRKQLVEIVERLNLPINSCGENYDQVRKCLLIGFFDNIAELQRDKTYLTVTGRHKAKIHPSSVFHQKYQPPYVIFTEIVLTERNYLRQITEILPEWVNEIVPNFTHLNRLKNSF